MAFGAVRGWGGKNASLHRAPSRRGGGAGWDNARGSSVSRKVGDRLEARLDAQRSAGLGNEAGGDTGEGR
jgi:hypothetical protein